MAKRNRRNRRSNKLKIGAASVSVLACLAGTAFVAMSSLGVRTPDKFGCFDDVTQKNTLVVYDASVSRNAEQTHRR